LSNVKILGTVSGPPSVLRPEQLNQPYREDSDDEGGYILGAWQYDDEALSESRPSSPVAPKSGFSRIAGGRANIDSPFTMASGTSTAFASTRAQANSPDHSASGSNLPPGAMAPGHVPHSRRKSQSAIIEDTAALLPGTNKGSAVPAPATGSSGSGSSGLTYNDPPHGSSTHPKRKNWFNNLFTSSPPSRPRRRASEADAVPMLPDEEPAAPDSASGGRSFQVIRDRRPSPLSQSQRPSGEDPEQGSTGLNVSRVNRTQGRSSAGPSPSPPASPPAIPLRSPRRRDGT